MTDLLTQNLIQQTTLKKQNVTAGVESLNTTLPMSAELSAQGFSEAIRTSLSIKENLPVETSSAVLTQVQKQPIDSTAQNTLSREELSVLNSDLVQNMMAYRGYESEPNHALPHSQSTSFEAYSTTPPIPQESSGTTIPSAQPMANFAVPVEENTQNLPTNGPSVANMPSDDNTPIVAAEKKTPLQTFFGGKTSALSSPPLAQTTSEGSKPVALKAAGQPSLTFMGNVVGARASIPVAQEAPPVISSSLPQNMEKQEVMSRSVQEALLREPTSSVMRVIQPEVKSASPELVAKASVTEMTPSTVSEQTAETASVVSQSPAKAEAKPSVTPSIVSEQTAETASVVGQAPAKAEAKPSVTPSLVSEQTAETATVVSQSPAKAEAKPSVSPSFVSEQRVETATVVSQSPAKAEAKPSVPPSLVSEQKEETATVVSQSPAKAEAKPSVTPSTVSEQTAETASVVGQALPSAEEQSPVFAKQTGQVGAASTASSQPNVKIQEQLNEVAVSSGQQQSAPVTEKTVLKQMGLSEKEEASTLAKMQNTTPPPKVEKMASDKKGGTLDVEKIQQSTVKTTTEPVKTVSAAVMVEKELSPISLNATSSLQNESVVQPREKRQKGETIDLVDQQESVQPIPVMPVILPTGQVISPTMSEESQSEITGTNQGEMAASMMEWTQQDSEVRAMQDSELSQSNMTQTMLKNDAEIVSNTPVFQTTLKEALPTEQKTNGTLAQTKIDLAVPLSTDMAQQQTSGQSAGKEQHQTMLFNQDTTPVVQAKAEQNITQTAFIVPSAEKGNATAEPILSNNSPKIVSSEVAEPEQKNISKEKVVASEVKTGDVKQKIEQAFIQSQFNQILTESTVNISGQNPAQMSPSSAWVQMTTPFTQLNAWRSEIAQRVDFARLNGQQEVTLIVNPEQLGAIEVKIALNHDKMTVVFKAEHADVAQALTDGLEDLRSNLAEKGIELTQANVVTDAIPKEQEGVVAQQMANTSQSVTQNTQTLQADPDSSQSKQQSQEQSDQQTGQQPSDQEKSSQQASYASMSFVEEAELVETPEEK